MNSYVNISLIRQKAPEVCPAFKQQSGDPSDKKSSPGAASLEPRKQHF